MTDFLFNKEFMLNQLNLIRKDLSTVKKKEIETGTMFFDLFNKLPAKKLPSNNLNICHINMGEIEIKFNPNFPENVMLVDDLLFFLNDGIISVHKVPSSVKF